MPLKTKLLSPNPQLTAFQHAKTSKTKAQAIMGALHGFAQDPDTYANQIHTLLKYLLGTNELAKTLGEDHILQFESLAEQLPAILKHLFKVACDIWSPHTAFCALNSHYGYENSDTVFEMACQVLGDVLAFRVASDEYGPDVAFKRALVVWGRDYQRTFQTAYQAVGDVKAMLAAGDELGYRDAFGEALEVWGDRKRTLKVASEAFGDIYALEVACDLIGPTAVNTALEIGWEPKKIANTLFEIHQQNLNEVEDILDNANWPSEQIAATISELPKPPAVPSSSDVAQALSQLPEKSASPEEARILKKLGQLKDDRQKGDNIAHTIVLRRIVGELCDVLLPAYFKTGETDRNVITQIRAAFHPDTKTIPLQRAYDDASAKINSFLDSHEAK